MTPLPDDATVARAVDQLTQRLIAAGVTDIRTKRRDHPGHVSIRFDYVGRDEACHATPVNSRLNMKANATGDDDIARAVAMACRGAEKLAERFGGLAPVVVRPGMSVDHLEVNAPLAERLRTDHGPRAVDIVREAVLILTENRKLRGNSRKASPDARPTPHDIKLNTNRLDHSEELAEGVLWRRHSIVIHRTRLPDVIVNGYSGARAFEVCDHPILADERNVVASISNVDTVAQHTKGTAVIAMTTPWIPVHAI